jgi:hypothetical protein
MTDARTNKVIEHTAASIRSALDKMMADLPEYSAPQMALEEVPFLITASELRDRKNKRRRKQNAPRP